MGISFSFLYNAEEITNNVVDFENNNDLIQMESSIISEEKGAYIFQDDENRIYRFLYFKLKPEEMQKALPITYKNNDNRNYLLVIFDPDGTDYLGQQTLQKVKEIIQNNKMTNLILTNWEEIRNVYQINEQEYLNMVKLAKEQLL